MICDGIQLGIYLLCDKSLTEVIAINYSSLNGQTKANLELFFAHTINHRSFVCVQGTVPYAKRIVLA